MNRRKALSCMVAGTLLPGAVAGCSCRAKGGGNGGKGGGLPGSSGKGGPASWEKKEPLFDLVDRISFASLRNRGICIDFGTTDYFKYTLGRWRTGWGRNSSREGVSFTEATGTTSRVFFPWMGAGDCVLKIRLLPQAATLASVYVNNTPVSKLDFPSKDWSSATLKVPRAMLSPSDNSLLLRWGGIGEEQAGTVAAWVDYIHLVEDDGSGSAEVPFLPVQGALAGSFPMGKDGQAGALLVPPGVTLSYYLRVPDEKAEPELGFLVALQREGGAPAAGQGGGGAGSAPAHKLRIRATADGAGAQETTLLEETFGPQQGAGLEARGVDLRELADRIVRLDISFTGPDAGGGGQARLVLARPAIWAAGKNLSTPPAAVRGAGRKAARNAILIMIDTLRADHVRCYEGNVKTPVLDRIAAEGVLYERFSAVEDWTKPSCATMFTGLYSNTHKTQTEAAMLPRGVQTIGDELRSRGFRTAGLIANGYISEKFGFKRGWDHYVNYIREGKPTGADHTFGDAADWIAKNRDARFFMYLHTIDPHVPYSPPDEFLKLYDAEPYGGPLKPRQTHTQLEQIKKGTLKVDARDMRRMVALYKGEISYHDKYLGLFMQQLAQMGILEDTFILITSDHGEEFWEHGSVGHGHSIFQELVHVPLIAMWKGTLPEGKRCPENHDHTIILPTIMDALGFDVPKYAEAASQLPLMLGQDEPAPYAGFSTHMGERMGVWSGDTKLQLNGPINTFLYDVKKDPGSKENVYKRSPVALHYMRALLGQFMGAPDKSDWKSSKLLSEKGPEVKGEDVVWDDDLKKQLKALGYIQE